ncbi:pyridoxal-phosphate dependent enzyme [Nanoarchaeota archaeon]
MIMKIESVVIKEIPFQKEMDWDLVEEWADGIPVFSENNPDNPEWPKTPTFDLDLSSEGYGLVHVKDESVNPTGTAKARPGWEMATIYRDFARGLWLQKGSLDGKILTRSVPELSLITSGNEGRAVSYFTEKYGLPPSNQIVDVNIDPKKLEFLKNLHANIYMVDLSKKELTQEDILLITGNRGGLNLNKALIVRSQEIWYDWLSHEAFNEEPDEIYVPYGSGKLRDNLLTWQEKNVRLSLSNGEADPRLSASIEKLLSMSILGAEPERQDSVADKLPAPFKPFRIFDNCDSDALINFSFTGKNTGCHQVREEYLKKAFEIFQKYNVTAEPSAAAGLALYMQRYDGGKINPRHKVLIVNTGRGI